MVISGLDVGDTHTFTRYVHNLLSMTEAVELEQFHGTRQVEYVFVGWWGS